MIDWYNLFFNALWILGCAIALAVLSYASWEASNRGEKFRVWMGQPHLQIPLNFAGLLFSLGLAGTSEPLWQRILWVLLALGFGIQIGATIIQQRTASQPIISDQDAHEEAK